MEIKKLREGYTTGTCAAAASKAAALMLFSGDIIEKINIMTPAGKDLNLEVLNSEITADYAVCAVKKDSGDDPDITNGILVFAKLRKISDGINIDGGLGVGRVTRKGLDQPVGSAAINSVPRKMIKNAVSEIMEEFGYRGGIDVEIFIPQGIELAKKTFNPNLGIEGGISVLGTSGIVEPMSEKALLDTIFLELKMHRENGEKQIVITPGNYGEQFLKSELGIENAVKCSNFIGSTIDYAESLGFSELLLAGHMGKLVKLGSGIMNTHSKYADGRMETLALCAAIADVSDFEKILDCVTTDEAYELIRDTKTIDILMEHIDYYLKKRTAMKIGAVMFSNKYGILGKTTDAESILKKARRK